MTNLEINNKIKIHGKYKHYKGDDYQVLGFCKHTETGEELVYYQALYGNHTSWVRPIDMFLSQIEFNGIWQPRFMLID